MIRKTLEQNGASKENFDHFYEMEKTVIELMNRNFEQATLDTFFKKKHTHTQ